MMAHPSQTQMTFIHPSSVVEDSVRLGTGVRVGPYCVISGPVEIGDGVELISHVTIAGHTTIGAQTVIYPFASIGHPPQDLKYAGEPSTLTIGARNKIREYVTMQPGTKDGGMSTTVGDDCLFMASTHVAHDCHVGNGVILANNATLAGHVIVGDHAIIGGLSAVHQFVRIGPHAIIGGMSAVEHDVIPYGSVKGERANLSGLNVVGLKRRGFNREQIDTLRAAYRLIFGTEKTLAERLEMTLERYRDDVNVADLVAFIQEDSTRSLCMPKESDRD